MLDVDHLWVAGFSYYEMRGLFSFSALFSCKGESRGSL